MNRFAPTPEQRDAIETLDRNVIVLASAGTGKTHVLVQRFLYLLERKPQWPLASILAITFTKKAAQQMRTRLRTAIRDKIRTEDPAAGWRRRLDELDRLQVSTVHSLCETILRDHALEAGLDPDFRVLDELEAHRLQEQALERMFQELETRGGACLPLLTQYTLQAFRSTLHFMLRKRSTLQEALDLDPNQWQIQRRTLIQEERRVQWDRYQQQHPELAAAMAWLARCPWWPADDKMGQKVEPARQAVQALQTEDWPAAIALLGTGGLGNMAGGSAAKWDSPEALELARAHIKAVNEVLKYLKKQSFHKRELIDPREVATLPLWLEAQALAAGHYQALKREQVCLDFDDLELLTQRLLTRAGQDTAGRVARWLAWINHVLVDEHQDINPVQQQIINCLAPKEAPGKLFVVGDTKQSIYRFRQAQVTEFADLAVSLRRITGQPEIHLQRSFRTHAALVAANNRLFAHILQPLHGTEFAAYEAKPMDLQSDLPAPGPDPCVELHVVRQPDANGPVPTTRERKLYEAQALVRRIGQLQSAGRLVRGPDDQERPLQLDDVVILMRSMGDLPLYEFVLRQAQMPYQVVTGTALKHQPHVRSLLALLKHLDNPSDDFHLAVALRSTLFGLSDETLYLLVQETRNQGWSLAEFPHLPVPLTDQPDRVQQAGAVLAELYDQVPRLSPDRMLQRILDATGYEATCMADPVRYRGVRHLEDIQAVRGYARQQRDCSLGEFLDYFEAVDFRRVRNEDENPAAPWAAEEAAVRIMTIHAAKGLEFPVVCVPQLDRGLGGHRARGPWSMVTFDDAGGLACLLPDARGELEKPLGYQAMLDRDRHMEYAETKRVFYVACTRAADLLVITGGLQQSTLDRDKATNFAKNWLTDVFDVFQLTAEDFTSPASWEKDFGAFRLGCFGYVADRAGLGVSPPHEASSRPRERQAALTEEPLLSRRPVPAGVAAYPQVATPAMQRGTLAHNILDPWDVWVDLPPSALYEYAVQKARQLNIWTDEVPRRLVSYLLVLRNTREAQEISQSPERFSEMPVLATTAGRTQLLRLDLVYKDRQGSWNLVDWKTERLAENTREQVKQRYLPALATYARAFHACTGQYPHTRLCFLASKIRWVPVTLDELLAVAPAADIKPDI